MGKYRKSSRGLSKRLEGHVLQGRRDTLYKMQARKNDGHVACYVCGKHVQKRSATLEHRVPRSHGGDSSMANLAISHNACNRRRGNDLSFDCVGAADWETPAREDT